MCRLISVSACRLIVLCGVLCLSMSCSSEPKPLPDAHAEAERGWSLLCKRDFGAARKVFEEMSTRHDLEQDIANQTLFGFALATSGLGDHVGAVELYERLAQREPDDADLLWRARFNLSWDYHQVGRDDLAEATLLRLLEMPADTAEKAEKAAFPSNRGPQAEPSSSYRQESPLSCDEEARLRYRHTAAFALAEHYVFQERYALAYTFLSAAKHAFPYPSSCANAVVESNFRLALLEHKILKGLGRREEASSVLLPYVFKTENGDEPETRPPVEAHRDWPLVLFPDPRRC